MNIKSINSKYIENPYQKNVNKIKTRISNKINDKVEISQEAKYLSEINTSKGEFNTEKIEELKRQIGSGTYSIDSKDLARKIIDYMKGEK
ncbi:MAG: flagellar biosynthesis anti-sigma factor FlgM [Peptostreptococcaceae bacterium]